MVETAEIKNKKNIKYKVGDVFAFPIEDKEFSFGRILLDIYLLKQNKLIPENHGLGYIMTRPLLIEIYGHTSGTPDIDIDALAKKPKLPSTYMMDNLIHSGDWPIVGHTSPSEEEFNFPISYGRIIKNKENVFLQWGLIHLEMPVTSFNKYLTIPTANPANKILAKGLLNLNPYGYYAVGMHPVYGTSHIKETIKNKGVFQFQNTNFREKYDLRNPINKEIRHEILKAFGLNPDADYETNRIITKTPRTTDLLEKVK